MDALSLAELHALERRGWEALCTGQGAAFYGDLMTDDGVMILVNGAVLDRDSTRASLDAAPAWDSYELTEPRRVAVGREAATLIYEARAERAGAPLFEALMSSTYVLIEGEPRLAVYQQTTITH